MSINLTRRSFWPLTHFSWIYYHWMSPSLIMGRIFSAAVIVVHLVMWIVRYNVNTLERGRQAQTEVANIIFYCLAGINAGTVPALVIIWISRGWKRVRNFVSEIEMIDDKLGRLGESPDKNSTLLKLIFPSCCIPVVMIFLMLFHRRFYSHGENSIEKIHITSIEYLYVFHELGVKLYAQCLFASCVLLLGDRYKSLNFIIAKISNKFHPRDSVDTWNWVLNLRELRAVNRKLFCAAEYVSEAFNLQLFITGLTSLTIIIGELYNFYLINALPCGLESPQIVEYLIECAIVIGQFYVIMFSCSRTYHQERSTASLLQDVKVEDESLRNEIQIFSLQLMHYKIGFSACGLWDVDLTFIVTIISTIMTYLIILVQIGTIPKICRNGFVAATADSENFTNSFIAI